jgi:hypothetical protein
VNGTLLSNSIRESKSFDLMCSALDTLEDTSLATTAYRESQHTSHGNLYLITYGILQVLFVQQDAAFHLAESIGEILSRKNFPKLNKIRDIRNKAAGHPTKKSRGKNRGEVEKRPHNFISRPTLRHGGFQLLSIGEGMRFQEIDLFRMVDDQDIEVRKVLRIVERRLKSEIDALRKKFEGQLLFRCFDQIGYDLEKLSSAIHGTGIVSLGKIALDLIESKIQDFGKHLREREQSEDSWRDDVKKAGHAIARLRAYMVGKSALSRPDAELFVDALRNMIDSLKSDAKEIDNQFSGVAKRKSGRRPRILISIRDSSDLDSHSSAL